LYRYRVKHCTYYLMQDQNEISYWPPPVLAKGHNWHPIEPTTIGYFHNIIFSNPVLNCFALTHWSKWIYSLAFVFEFKYVVCDGFFHIFTLFFNVSLRLEAQAHFKLYLIFAVVGTMERKLTTLNNKARLESLSSVDAPLFL